MSILPSISVFLFTQQRQNSSRICYFGHEQNSENLFEGNGPICCRLITIRIIFGANIRATFPLITAKNFTDFSLTFINFAGLNKILIFQLKISAHPFFKKMSMFGNCFNQRLSKLKETIKNNCKGKAAQDAFHKEMKECECEVKLFTKLVYI